MLMSAFPTPRAMWLVWWIHVSSAAAHHPLQEHFNHRCPNVSNAVLCDQRQCMTHDQVISGHCPHRLYTQQLSDRLLESRGSEHALSLGGSRQCSQKYIDCFSISCTCMNKRQQKATQLSDAVIANCLKPMQTNGFFSKGLGMTRPRLWPGQASGFGSFPVLVK
jgi:hypothetical protein